MKTRFTTELKNKNNFLLLLFAIATPIIIYLYFLKWKTNTAYGDDLFIYREYLKLHTFSEKINLPVPNGKYRPLHGMSISFLIELFQKNLNGYYFFNVAIQTINALLFASILNLFLKSPFFALLLGLTVGLSRLFYFNIAQLLNGGALEGLAMVFFLAFLYFLCKAFISNGGPTQKSKALLVSIVFANLSMYTHERYIILFPFIILTVFLSPSLKEINLRTRTILSSAALISLVLNVVIKKSVFSLPFFVGTAGTNIEFSFSSAVSFFFEAILTLFQINSGPEYLVGIPFWALPRLNKILALVFAAGTIAIFILYFVQVRNFFQLKQKDGQSGFLNFLLLSLLGIMLLIPATITIRLEQRWLEASFSIFILLVIIALNNLNFKYIRKKYALLLFFILFLWTDFNYLSKGGDNFSMSYSAKLASGVKQAIDNGTLSHNTDQLYIWEKLRRENDEQAIWWVLGGGYFFEFYQGKPKQISFADSIYNKSYSFAFSSFPGFNKSTAQIIYLLNNKVYDLTQDYLQDSLKHFVAKGINNLESNGGIQYDQTHLQVVTTNADKFLMDGFYENQNGIRWTNGNASIGFKSDFIAKDSLSVELYTYMPSVCKDISPRISIVTDDSTTCDPLYSNRNGDAFVYKFYFKQPMNIQKINIISDTIKLASGDARRLSFPFISLELKK